MRAYLYFNLVRLYGDVPKRFTPTEVEEQAYLARSPMLEIYDEIIIPDLGLLAK